MLGPGSLPAARGERHLRMRRVLTPAFAPKTVATYLPRIVAIANECVDRWLQLGSFTAHHEVNRFTFQVLSWVPSLDIHHRCISRGRHTLRLPPDIPERLCLIRNLHMALSQHGN